MIKDLVSIIIPAYNVEKYLDECMKTVVKQTYKNIEIILINDGSTDNTGHICKKWEKKDSRIKYISKKNEGPGITRNRGIDIAKGEYLFFLDSDDWIELNAIEELLKLAKSSDADVTAANYFEVDDVSGQTKKMQRSTLIKDIIETDLDRNIYLQYGFVMVWGKLYRRKFMTSNQLYMPGIPHEDNAIFPMVVFLANKIACSDLPIYFYRTNRAGSIISDYRSRTYMADACGYFMKYFAEKNLVGRYYASLKRYAETRIYFSYELCKEKIGPDYVEKYYLPKTDKIFDTYFPDTKRLWEYNFWVLGSFSSRWIVQQIGINKEQLMKHIPFSSLISQMTENVGDDIIVENENAFRKDTVLKDYRGELLQLLKTDNEKPDFFVIDFLEERFDICKLEDGNYITLSEAYLDSKVNGINIKQIIKAGTDDYMELWKEKCKDFTIHLKKFIDAHKLILIRSRLSQMYENGQEYLLYSEQDKLEHLNHIFEEMENFFLREMGKSVQVYYMPDKAPYTPENFKYGVKPQYWDHDTYREMTAKIRVSFDKMGKR